ncbi:MAG: hypothetical protein ACK4YP_18695 [Myxococcota bacterium]
MWVVLMLSACSTPAPSPPAPQPDAPAVTAGAAANMAVEAPRAAGGGANRDRPPTIESVTLTPDAPKPTDILVAAVKAHDRETDKLDLDFAWYVNDAPIPEVASERLGGRFKKGDTVRVVATADDGTTEVSAESEPVTIGNTPPVFETGPKDVTRVDGFAFKASDPDGDALQWRLEGAPAGMALSAEGVLSYPGVADDEPGGRYLVKVTADDGTDYVRFEFPVTVTPGKKVQAAAR